MVRTNKIIICVLSVLLLLLFTNTAHSAQSENLPQVISYLVQFVSTSNLTFIRNGEKHTCDEAATHMIRKYDYFKNSIKTPEDFIRLCATKSILSGKPYLVQTANGIMPANEWLKQVLAVYRKDHADS